MLHIRQDPTDPHGSSDRIGRVLPEHVQRMYDELKLFLEEHPDWLTEVDSPDRILQLCAMGAYEAWVALSPKGELEVLGICSWDRHQFESYYHILYLAGSNLWAHFRAGLAEAEKYTYLNGGAEIVLLGRHGWKRALRRFGYESPKVLLSKNVRKARGN
jgi:hypothetical protein